MTAAATMARAEAVGVAFSLVGGTVQMQARRPPPPDLLAELRANKEEVARLLAVRAAMAGGDSLVDAPSPPPTPAPAQATPSWPTPDEDKPEQEGDAGPLSEEWAWGTDWSAVDEWIAHGSGSRSPTAFAAHFPIPTDPLAGLHRAALARPARWMDSRAIPGPGTYCAACDGRRWGWDAFLWRCLGCHPDAGGTRDNKEITT